jgi:hypothetical protein
MNIGILDDIIKLRDLFTDQVLINTLKNAECGYFNNRSWHYWHYILLKTSIGQVPPLPQRNIGNKHDIT